MNKKDISKLVILENEKLFESYSDKKVQRIVNAILGTLSSKLDVLEDEKVSIPELGMYES